MEGADGVRRAARMKWFARVVLSAIPFAVLVVLWMIQVTTISDVWPILNRHPRLLVLLVVVLSWMVLGVLVLIVAGFAVRGLWKRAR